MANKTVTVKPSDGDYTTLALAIAGEADDLTAVDYYEGGPGILTVSIEGDWSGGADTTAVNITGFTTSADYYINIVADSNNRAVASSYDANRYRLEVSNDHCIDVNEDYVRINGLQLYHHSLAADDICLIYFHAATAGATVYVGNCRLKGANQASYQEYGIRAGDADFTGTIYNTIIYNFDPTDITRCIRTYTGAINILNCTLCGAQRGIHAGYDSTVVKNTAIFNTSDDFYDSFDTIDYCASDDADGDHAQNFAAEATDWNKVFEDYSNGDFRLKDYTTEPCCVGKGTDNPGSGLYTDDINGESRTSSWDIGASEYVAEAGGSVVPIIQQLNRRRNG